MPPVSKSPPGPEPTSGQPGPPLPGQPGPLPEHNPDGVDVHLDEHGERRIIVRRFVVEEAFAGYRLDHYLKRKIPRLSRTKLQRLIRARLDPVRGRILKPHSAVATGDAIVMRTPARPEPPCPRVFTVLHDDPWMMVIDKPAGLPVHASARYYFNTLTRVLSERYPGQDVQICHRLDRETSGLLVLARGRSAAARIKSAFAAHGVQKTYLAVVRGNPPWPDGPLPGPDAGAPPETHAIDLPLGLIRNPDALIDIRMVVRADARPARTLTWVVERCSDHALVACVPVTGRQHQIRAHLAATGHAIVGDKLYAHGDEAFARFCDHGMSDELIELFRLPRHALHAAAICVPHPHHGEPVRVTSALPPDLRGFLDRMAGRA